MHSATIAIHGDDKETVQKAIQGAVQGAAHGVKTGPFGDQHGGPHVNIKHHGAQSSHIIQSNDKTYTIYGDQAGGTGVVQSFGNTVYGGHASQYVPNIKSSPNVFQSTALYGGSVGQGSQAIHAPGQFGNLTQH